MLLDPQHRSWFGFKNNYRDSTIVIIHYCSRKHGKKEMQSFSHYGSFDHPDMQSLKNCRFIFCFYTCNFEILGACNTPLERYFQGIIKKPKFLKFQLVNPKKIAFLLLTTNQGGQKDRNGKTTMLLFFTMFSTSDCLSLPSRWLNPRP